MRKVSWSNPTCEKYIFEFDCDIYNDVEHVWIGYHGIQYILVRGLYKLNAMDSIEFVSYLYDICRDGPQNGIITVLVYAWGLWGFYHMLLSASIMKSNHQPVVGFYLAIVWVY